MEQAVQDLLRSFIDRHLSDECQQTEIDDVLLTYVAGVLDGIAGGETGDDFDVEEFADVMSAYVPGFDSVERAVVYEWIFSAASSLRSPVTGPEKESTSSPANPTAASDSTSANQSTASSSQTTGGQLLQQTQAKFVSVGDGCNPGAPDLSSLSLEDRPSGKATDGLSGTCKQKSSKARASRTPAISTKASSKGDASRAVCGDALENVRAATDENALLLQDMFPDTSLETIHGAVLEADGVLEQAISLLLEKQADLLTLGASAETTSSVPKSSAAVARSPPNKTESCASSGSSLPLTAKENSPDHARIKDFVLGKYLLVDEAEDERQHRPHFQAAPKSQHKTMYRDNHVVSTKGERYSMVSKKDQEDDDMKKTYVSLKPFRKYRFH